MWLFQGHFISLIMSFHYLFIHIYLSSIYLLLTSQHFLQCILIIVPPNSAHIHSHLSLHQLRLPFLVFVIITNLLQCCPNTSGCGPFTIAGWSLKTADSLSSGCYQLSTHPCHDRILFSLKTWASVCGTRITNQNKFFYQSQFSKWFFIATTKSSYCNHLGKS